MKGPTKEGAGHRLRRGFLSLFFVLPALSMQAHAEGTLEKPKGIISMIDTLLSKDKAPSDTNSGDPYRLGPFIEVIHIEHLETFQKNRCSSKTPEERNKDPQACPRFEWSVPYLVDPTDPLKSPIDVTREIAGEIETEWKNFQDIMYWRIYANVNNTIDPMAVLPHMKGFSCWLSGITEMGLGLTRNPKQFNSENPRMKVTVLEEEIYKDWQKPANNKNDYSFQADTTDFSVGWAQWIRPTSSFEDICSQISPSILDIDVILDYTPEHWLCGFLGCIKIWNVSINNWATYAERARDACNKTLQQEYANYWKRIGEIIAKRMPLAMHWNGFFGATFTEKGGVIFQPIWANPGDGNLENKYNIWKLIQDSGNPNALPYYTKGQPLLDTTLIENRQQTRSGNWQLEENKRWLEPSTLVENEHLGYSTLYQIWAQPDWEWEWRPVMVNTQIWTNFSPNGGNIPIPGPNVVVTPAGCQVAASAGSGNITYMNFPRVHFAWKSVPEGYAIPGVKDTPVVLPVSNP